jgi:glycerol-3-phosphate O-acyltransferase
MREHPTLLLFTHKTYIDGVTATDLAYQNDLPLIHLFGGINLDFFGLGFMLRRAGTIFIRRSFENNPAYKLVLRYYVSYLLEKRFPMTWAFEGTRSRLGKLMPPRYGLLKYVMDSAHSNEIENVHIIPVVTSFDLIRDVEEYASEQTGRIKKPESLSWFIGYLRSLREPMGKVYVDFGEPVVVRKAPNPNDRLALSKMAFEVAVQANRERRVGRAFAVSDAPARQRPLTLARRGATADQHHIVAAKADDARRRDRPVLRLVHAILRAELDLVRCGGRRRCGAECP